MVCKVTDCVTGETYVRGAAGRMAAEIERLKALVADLERENEELQRNTKPRFSFEHTSPHTVPGLPSSVAMRGQNHPPLTWEQRIFLLQQENNKLRQQTAVLRDNNQTLLKKVEEQDSMISMNDVCPTYPLDV